MLFLMLPLAVKAQSTEDIVRTAFVDAPVMIDIARCESKFTQFNSNGTFLRGGMGQKMIGIFQIYEDIHATYAKGIGMDIYTTEGNMAYARHLYEREGTQPWLSSFPCWGKEVNTSTAAAPADTLTLNLSMGMEHPQIMLLQKTLNAKGYVVSPDGPGSVGQETQKFGALTRVAVRTFQCAEMQICDGDEHSTGYGFVGSKTRAALLASKSQPVAQNPTVEGYTQEEQKRIAELQAQIVELTKVLQALLAAR